MSCALLSACGGAKSAPCVAPTLDLVRATTTITAWVAGGPLKDFKLTVDGPSQCIEAGGKVEVRYTVELPPAGYAMSYSTMLRVYLDDKTGMILDADERRMHHAGVAEQLAAIPAFEADPEVAEWIRKYTADIQLESGVGWAKWCVRYKDRSAAFLKYCPDGVGVVGYEIEELKDARRPEAQGLAEMLHAKLPNCSTSYVAFYREIDENRIDKWEASGTLLGRSCNPSSFEAHKNVGTAWMLD